MLTGDQNPDSFEAEERGSSAPARHFYIDIVTHNGLRQRLPLPAMDLVIGRSPGRCQLVLDDNHVSRVHLRVSRSPEKGITLTDLYSANGTLFDGHRLQAGVAIVWLINQVVIIGDTRLTLRYGSMDTKRLSE